MEQLAKDIIGKLKTPSILNSRFTQLIDSLSGLRSSRTWEINNSVMKI